MTTVLADSEKDSFRAPASTAKPLGAGASSVDVQFEGGKSAGRIPPHSVDSEKAVLGAVLIDNESVNAVLEVLAAKDFYQRSHQVLFQAMVDLSERLEPVDVVTLTESLRASAQLDAVGGIEYISHLVDTVPTSSNAQYYARIIKEMSLRRSLIHTANEIAQEAFNERGEIDRFLDSVEQRIFGVAEERINPSFCRVGDIVKDSIKHVEWRYTNKEPITGTASGFTELDTLTSGFQPSDLVVLAGRPSMGKTALALSIARHVGIELKQACAVFSLEMSREQIVTRILCAEARVSSARVRSGKLAESDFPRLVDAASEIAQAPIFIDDTPALSVLEMRAKTRRLHKENPLSLVVVDYLQLMRAPSRRIERREQEISEISGALKALAKELRIPVVALSQLNRGVEARQDKRPMMADLRESGAIEQDADIIGFIYRDEVYNPDTPDKGIAEVIISKHRNGATANLRLAFVGEFTVFENLADEVEYDYLGEDLELGDDDEIL